MKTRNVLRGLMSVLFGCMLMLLLVPSRAYADGTTLPTPTNVRFDGLKIKCDPVDGATDYIFVIYATNSTDKWFSYLSKGTYGPELDLTGAIYDGKWKVEVTAYNNDAHTYSETTTYIGTITGTPKGTFNNVRLANNEHRQVVIWDWPSYKLVGIYAELILYKNSVAPENVVTYLSAFGPSEFDCHDLPLEPGTPYYLGLRSNLYLNENQIGPVYALNGKVVMDIEDGAPAKANKKLTATFVPNDPTLTPGKGTYEWRCARSENGPYYVIKDKNGNPISGNTFTPTESYNHCWIYCTYSALESNFIGVKGSDFIYIDGVESPDIQGDINFENNDGTLIVTLENANCTDYYFSFEEAGLGKLQTDGGNSIKIKDDVNGWDLYGKTITCTVKSREKKQGFVSEEFFIKNQGANVKPVITEVSCTGCVIRNVKAGHEYSIVPKNTGMTFTSSASFYTKSVDDNPIVVEHLNDNTEYTLYERATRTETSEYSPITFTYFKTLKAPDDMVYSVAVIIDATNSADKDQVARCEVSVNDGRYKNEGAAVKGTKVKLTPKPYDKASNEADNYHFVGWEVVDGDVDIVGNEFIMPDVIPSDGIVKIKALFERHKFTTKASDKEATPATCTTPATYYVQCDGCDAVSTSKTVAVGSPKHSFNEKASTSKETDATCTTAARYFVQCDHCDEVTNTKTVEVGEPLGHSFTTQVSDQKATDATCSKAATYYLKCDRCGEVSTDKAAPVGDPIDHKWGDWQIANETQHKKICQYDSSHVETAAHNFNGNVCTDCGYDKQKGYVTVVFESADGTKFEELNVTTDGKITKPSSAPVDAGGGKFIGWYKDKECSTEWDFDKDSVTDSISLYPAFGYIVRFDTDGGTSVADQTVVTGHGLGKDPGAPTRGEDEFFGWVYKDKEKSFEMGSTVISSYAEGGVITLYANWEKGATPAPEPEKAYYQSLIDQLRAYVASGNEGVIVWTAGDSLPLEAIELLKQSNAIIEFKYTYMNKDYDVFISKNNAPTEKHPWYGPLYLAGLMNNSSAELAALPANISSGEKYVIKKGDTLLQIAEKYEVTLQYLLSKNKQIINPDRIYAGQELEVK